MSSRTPSARVALITLPALCSLALAHLSGQDTPPPAPPPPPEQIEKPPTPARIKLSEGPPFVRFSRPVTIHLVSRLQNPPSTLTGIDRVGVAFGDLPAPDKIALFDSVTRLADSTDATGVLASARKLCEKYLKIDLRDPDWSGILDHNGEDVAVARWNRLRIEEGLRSVFLWDEPVSTSLIIELPDETLRNPGRIEGFLTRLIIWGEALSESLHVELIDCPDAQGELMRGNIGFHYWYQVQSPGPPRAFVMGYANRGSALLSITFAKDLAYNLFDPGMMFIAERFPPLHSRVGTMSTEALLNAIGRGGRTETSWRIRDRDRILLDELISRQDFTEDDFHDLVQHRPLRVQTLEGPLPPDALREAVQNEAGARFVPIIIEHLRTLEKGTAEYQASNLAFMLTRNSPRGFCELTKYFRDNGLETHYSSTYYWTFCSTH